MLAYRPKTAAGFTLIELLIVLAIISLLSVALLPQIWGASQSGARAETQGRMLHLRNCIETYENRYGDYPSDDFTRFAVPALKGVKADRVNAGIESVLVHIHGQNLGSSATFENHLDWLGNTDGDDAGVIIPMLDSSKKKELLDGWQMPLVYFHNATYGKSQSVRAAGEGSLVEKAKAWKNVETGQYLGPRGYQIISAGPDQLFNTDDDLTYPERPLNP